MNGSTFHFLIKRRGGWRTLVPHAACWLWWSALLTTIKRQFFRPFFIALVGRGFALMETVFLFLLYRERGTVEQNSFFFYRGPRCDMWRKQDRPYGRVQYSIHRCAPSCSDGSFSSLNLAVAIGWNGIIGAVSRVRNRTRLRALASNEIKSWDRIKYTYM